jgi:hypothetical protein
MDGGRDDIIGRMARPNFSVDATTVPDLGVILRDAPNWTIYDEYTVK